MYNQQMDYSSRIEYIQKNIRVYVSQMGIGFRTQYAICNRIQGTFPGNAMIHRDQLEKLQPGDKIFINCLIPNIDCCLQELYDFLMEKQKESTLPLQYQFLLMGEPTVPRWIVDKIYPLTERIYLDNNVYDDVKIGYMPIGIRDGEEIHQDHQHFTGQYILDEIKQSRPKEILCLLCFSYTHPERQQCENALGNQDFVVNLNKSDYHGQPSIHCGKVPVWINYEYTHKSDYTLSPSGEGEATHRFYEAIALNTIPIVKRTCTPFDKIYDDFPCLVVDKWEDVTQTLLKDQKPFWTEKMKKFHEQYPDFLTNPEYDFCR